jgi:hypothetical protein
MKLETLRRKAESLGLTTNTETMTSGSVGLFISLEQLVNGKARSISRETEGALFRYLTRYKIPYEFRGYYKSLLIQYWDGKAESADTIALVKVAQAAADDYLTKYGKDAPKHFLYNIPLTKHAPDVIRLIIDKLNAKVGGNKEIVQCGRCHDYSLWGGFDSDATQWSCEICGVTFCDNCAHVDNENDECVLCDVCRVKHERVRERCS